MKVTRITKAADAIAAAYTSGELQRNHQQDAVAAIIGSYLDESDYMTNSDEGEEPKNRIFEVLDACKAITGDLENITMTDRRNAQLLAAKTEFTYSELYDIGAAFYMYTKANPKNSAKNLLRGLYECMLIFMEFEDYDTNESDHLQKVYLKCKEHYKQQKSIK